MIQRTLKEIASMIAGASAADEDQAVRIAGVSIDSRSIEKGNLFIPLVGANADGHQFAESALQHGAAAALWQRDHGTPPAGPVVLVDDALLAMQQLASSYRDQTAARVVAVTGSNGKTTTKDLVASVLATTYKVHKTEGNYNSHIGLPLTLLSMPETTEMAVLEMGMRGRGEIALLSRLAKPEVAVITNVGEAHLEQLGSREEIARAKLEIVYGLAADGLFLYNGDDPLLIREFEQLLQSPPPDVSGDQWKLLRFGEQSSNDLYPEGMMTDGTATHFSMNTIHSTSFTIPLLGRHNVVNALAAVAVAKYMGVSTKDVRSGLAQAKLSGMRIEMTRSAGGYTLLNDAYNASPASMKAALTLLAELRGYKRKIAVLGDMLELGPEQADFHRDIGEALDPVHIDYVYTYGELGEHIAAGALSHYNPQHVQAFRDKEKLIAALKQLVRPDDIILIKGSRGMKLEVVADALQ
ncbi:UDP-N-acetylmuramoyl-tripeptide--D-alanyl-D-alanine ligase [Xylanibacillus composti]|uniref:UDP-N-acetylmuramoyl-tripeptide--D-alanyl-D-alanine ligase n=1 Tax=Xylanibacillus composti TaxID=1572762 RepID=A0A8J4H1Z3_9BACL|nr:UDP-N-acetylmuramoyl-tripeptide--D-alanyl-D-alanine ligase [Xylanibacillus composti]MDT9724370.1 UDP-N-acetylmuramoyl-tripeptide--D-alanyl-D-alanine ligase [Xylanibacillus composti]GIQ67961.1 UDP-N-acetylmuramoyl-tripeptide--D-alanyl-D-alanine ligase [Xylanibacillus composti]